MKIASKKIIVLSFILTGLFARQWVEIGASRPSEPNWDVNSISDRHLEISFDVGGYFLEQLPNGKNRITFPGSVPILDSGAPELPRMARSIIIPDLAHMELSVLETEFIDVPMENIEPSKGNLTRDIDPSTIPYTYGKPYQ
ncbi:MAG: C25 family peptidase propeptide domain-containing protein, partial [Candidatus Neomarinimicrobiota bacterium]|nr:C25 family peptidase propeptide domain-containing protein [Candidatus Neomarinimicrobiota bacterium]